MLSDPTPFPQTGSYALHQVPGSLRLARIQRRETVGADQFAFISYPAQGGASGNATVLLADLIDGTPLTDAETADLRALDERRRRQLALKRGERARLTALAQRRLYSRTLATLLAKAGLAAAPQGIAA